MPMSFTQYWRYKGLFYNVEGAPCNHTAGSTFRQKGVAKGNRVYIVTIHDGRLLLVGAMTVSNPPLTYAQARKQVGLNIYKARDHLTGHSVAPIKFDRIIPDNVARQLRFDSLKGEKRLCFRGKRVDPQAVRGLRRLSPRSAKLLDELIGVAALPVGKDFVDCTRCIEEGKPVHLSIVARRRCEALRNRAREHYREQDGLLRCAVCTWHRPLRGVSNDIVELHHLDPVASAPPAGRKITLREAIRCLTPLCPNCHRIAHSKGRGRVYSLRELRQVIPRARGF